MKKLIPAREQIKILLEQNVSVENIIRKLDHLKLNRRFVYRVAKQYRETKSIAVKPRTGRKRIVRTKKLIKVIRERIRRNPAQSVRKLAREFKCHHSTMQINSNSTVRRGYAYKPKGSGFETRFVLFTRYQETLVHLAVELGR